MRTRALGWVLGILAVFLVVGGIVTGQQEAEEMNVPMGTILIEPPDSIEPKRSAVEFPHSLHFSNSCTTCHHKWELTTPIVGCRTSGCHDLFESPLKEASEGSPKTLPPAYFKKAYHDMCIGCHKRIKEENKKLEASYRKLEKPLPAAGPTSCRKCHPTE